MTEPSLYLVIAGNYRQFDVWRRERGVNPRKAVYVDSVERVMGLRAAQCRYVLTGRYWDNANYGEIMDRIRSYGIQRVAEDFV